MIPAILTAILFAFSAVFSQRAARIFGPIPANAWRLCIACAVLGIATKFLDDVRGFSSIKPEVFTAFFWSGFIGFGIGDIALFLAYPLLGARLTILINWCGATLFAAAGDHYLLHRSMTPHQWWAVLGIMAGLLFALWPESAGRKNRLPIMGAVYAAVAGFSMGWGTVLSQHANQLAGHHHLQVHGISQAFQRCTAGVIVSLIAWAILRFFQMGKPNPEPIKQWRHKPFWLISTALCGPVLGVSCYQWAQLSISESAVLVAIVSTSTLLVIPLAQLTEKESPGRRQIMGTILASLGVAGLCFLRGR